MGHDEVIVSPEERRFGLVFGMILQVGLVDQRRNSKFHNLHQVLIGDKISRGIVRGTDDDQLRPGGDGPEHGRNVILEIRGHVNGNDLAPAGFCPNPIERKGRMGKENFVTRGHKESHDDIDDLGGAVADIDVFRSEIIALRDLGAEPGPIVGIPVPQSSPPRRSPVGPSPKAG